MPLELLMKVKNEIISCVFNYKKKTNWASKNDDERLFIQQSNFFFAIF